MAEFTKSNQRNLIRHTVYFYPHQIDFFQLVLKLNKRNINKFIRIAVDRAIEAETTKHL